MQPSSGNVSTTTPSNGPSLFSSLTDKPVCRAEHQRTSYGGAKGLTSEIECHVESKPGATSFRWAFNGTGELTEMAMGSYRTTADGSISILRYTPKSDLDFGTLLCWASNPLGTQAQPCVYNLYAAGKAVSFFFFPSTRPAGPDWSAVQRAA